MAFLYITPEEFEAKLIEIFPEGAKAESFRSPTTFERTEEGRLFHKWLVDVGTVPDIRLIEKWIGGTDQIAIMGFGHDYDIIRDSVSPEQSMMLDRFYAPVRTATFRPQMVESDDFDTSILKCLGVDFAFTPKQCWELREIGYYDPFVAHFAETFKNPPGLSIARIRELVSDRDSRNLLGRYDALGHVLRAAYHYGSHSGTGKHLLTTYHW